MFLIISEIYLFLFRTHVIYYAGQIGKGELTWDADYYNNTYTQYTINMENSQDHEDRTVTSSPTLNTSSCVAKLISKSS